MFVLDSGTYTHLLNEHPQVLANVERAVQKHFKFLPKLKLVNWVD